MSGLLAAAIPAAVSSVLEGAPGAVAAGGIRGGAGGDLGDCGGAFAGEHAGDGSEPSESTRMTLALAIVGGLGFGIYFVALRLANALGVMEPMALARSASLVTCLCCWCW